MYNHSQISRRICRGGVLVLAFVILLSFYMPFEVSPWGIVSNGQLLFDSGGRSDAWLRFYPFQETDWPDRLAMLFGFDQRWITADFVSHSELSDRRPVERYLGRVAFLLRIPLLYAVLALSLHGWPLVQVLKRLVTILPQMQTIFVAIGSSLILLAVASCWWCVDLGQLGEIEYGRYYLNTMWLGWIDTDFDIIKARQRIPIGERVARFIGYDDWWVEPYYNSVGGIINGRIGSFVWIRIPLIYFAVALLSFAWFRRRRSAKPGFCRCGYDLTGNTSGRCPECGVAVSHAKEPSSTR